MKKILLAIGLLLLVAVGALATTFLPQTLAVPEKEEIATAPSPHIPQGVSIRAILTGKMYSLAAFGYRGGSFGETRIFNMGSILVDHPQGRILIDAGLGEKAEQHLQTMPWLMRNTTQLETEPGTGTQLEAAGITPDSLKGIYLTHAHWDHVSGIDDLQGVPVMVPKAEMVFIESGHPMTALARSLGTDRYQTYEFDGGSYLGFDRSHDLFGDGSIVIVPAPGHTPGSVFIFVTTSSGERYAFIGDTAWQREGVQLPAEKPWLARQLVDTDSGKVRNLLVRLHVLMRDIPGLKIVPAHDRRVWDELPQLSGS